MATAAQLETQTSLLAIVDAAHEVESALLLRWLGDQKADANTQMQTVTLAIGKDPDNLETGVLETELDARDDTLVLPVRVVWQDRRTDPRATPRLLDLLKGDPRRPGLRRARKLLQQDPANAQCVQGAPATIGELRAQFAEQGGEPESRDAFARFVSGQASIALDIAERQMRGGRYKVPRRVADNIKRSKRFKDGVAELSERLGEPVEALEARAEEIFSELIARPRGFWQDIIAAFNRRVISMGYQPEFVVDEGRLKEIRDLVRQHPTALLWTHKTHIDGFAVFSMLFENDFPVPHLLGGVNMAFAGLGYAAKRSGAIFIRRSFQDDPLYKMILRQYIGYLLEKRFPVSWAFEGTRSRVGKLMPPRYGILKYVLEAADASDAKDLKVIPIALNYDLIRDVKDYVREQAGGVKQPESLRWFIGYLRGLRKPLGKIYIDFGDPIVINKSPAQDDSLGLKKIAFQVGVETNRVTPVTLTSLVSTILLGHAPRALTRLELGKEMVRYLRWARDRNIPLADELERDDLTAINRLADILGDHGLITRYDEGPDVVYTIVPEQHHEASYYRNTTIHHFIVKAIAEMALMKAIEAPDNRANILRQEAAYLRDLFKFEFFYAPRLAFDASVDAELRRYEPDWETQINASESDAQQLLQRFHPHVASAALLPFVESYRIVASILARLPGDEGIDAKSCLSQALAFGKQAYLQRRITTEASVGKLLFENAYQQFDHQHLITPRDGSLRQARTEALAQIADLANRLERIKLQMTPTDRW